jgi:hypothetical protein
LDGIFVSSKELVDPKDDWLVWVIMKHYQLINPCKVNSPKFLEARVKAQFWIRFDFSVILSW